MLATNSSSSMSPKSTTKNRRYENDKKNVHKDNSNKISPSRSSPPGFRQNLHTSRWSGSILPKNLACLNAPFLFAFYCSKRWFTFSFYLSCFCAKFIGTADGLNIKYPQSLKCDIRRITQTSIVNVIYRYSVFYHFY